MRVAVRFIAIIKLLSQGATNAVKPLVHPIPFIFLLQCLALSQGPPQQRTKVANQTVSSQASRPSLIPTEQLDKIEKRLAALESDQAKSSSDTQGRLDRIEKAIADLKHSSGFMSFAPAVIAALAGLGGVLLGGLLNERLQSKRLVQEASIASGKADHEKQLATDAARQERDLSEKQAQLQIGHAVVEWQLKQLSLLYGPVRALLGQSFGLYRQMNKVLETADGSKFRFVSVAGSLDSQQFQIKIPEGTWERFRTVMHISQVYGQGFGVETYFDEIVGIGERIVKIIEQQAGYARPQEKELMTVFAKYLAHFAVLKHLHEEAKRKLASEKAPTTATTSPEPSMTVDLSAVFPEELHGLINQGFEAITKDIEEWRRKAGA